MGADGRARRLAGALLRGARLAAAALLAGVVAGAVAGLGSRLAMWVIRLMNPTHNGEVTHANAEVGRWTAAGTLDLVYQGVFYGLPGVLVYLLVRRWLPGHLALRGLAFGILLLVVGGPVVIDGNYEYFRYVSPWIGVLLFAALYPLYGMVMAPLTEWLGGGRRDHPANRALRVAGYLALSLVVAVSLAADIAVLRDDFRLFG